MGWPRMNECMRAFVYICGNELLAVLAKTCVGEVRRVSLEIMCAYFSGPNGASEQTRSVSDIQE